MELQYLWSIFLRLSSRRTSNGYGPNPITFSDIDAFVRHSGISLAPWEVELIEQLDDLWRTQQAKTMKAQTRDG